MSIKVIWEGSLKCRAPGPPQAFGVSRSVVGPGNSSCETSFGKCVCCCSEDHTLRTKHEAARDSKGRRTNPPWQGLKRLRARNTDGLWMWNLKAVDRRQLIHHGQKPFFKANSISKSATLPTTSFSAATAVALIFPTSFPN